MIRRANPGETWTAITASATSFVSPSLLPDSTRLSVEPDDVELVGDGIDATRVVLRVTDEFGATRPFADGAVALTLTGPGEIIGENPFALFGGVGAVWIKTKESSGTIRLTANHPKLGAKTIEIRVKPMAVGQTAV